MKKEKNEEKIYSCGESIVHVAKLSFHLFKCQDGMKLLFVKAFQVYFHHSAALIC